MSRARMAPCSAHGVEGSPAPPITSVGTRIFPNTFVWSTSRRAAQQATYPAGSVPRNTERTDCTYGSPSASMSAENQRCIVVSTSAAMPPSRTVRRRASHGESTQRESLNAERIGQRQHVAPQLLERVVARRHGGSAMPARVVTQHPKMLQQVRDLRSPHIVIATQGMREHQHRLVRPAFKPVEQARVVYVRKRQALLLPAGRSI